MFWWKLWLSSHKFADGRMWSSWTQQSPHLFSNLKVGHPFFSINSAIFHFFVLPCTFRTTFHTQQRTRRGFILHDSWILILKTVELKRKTVKNNKKKLYTIYLLNIKVIKKFTVWYPFSIIHTDTQTRNKWREREEILSSLSIEKLLATFCSWPSDPGNDEFLAQIAEIALILIWWLCSGYAWSDGESAQSGDLFL